MAHIRYLPMEYCVNGKMLVLNRTCVKEDAFFIAKADAFSVVKNVLFAIRFVT